jgi:hypothetical protein
MKTRDRPNFSKKLVKTTTVSVAVLVAAIMIISAIPTIATPGNTTKMNKIEKIEQLGDPTGLDPVLVEKNSRANSLESPMAQPSQPSGPISEDGFFYACSAFSPFPVVRWELETGDGKETIKSSGDNTYFLGGGTYSCDEEWYGAEYNSGGLWKINPDTGDMENIGGGGTSLNGLAWDPVYNRLYGAGSYDLYEIDPETGEQEHIGNYGISNAIICLIIDMDGVAWAYDVKFGGDAILYNIDLETGEATEFCSMGRNLVYAQDGDMDRDTGIIWMAAYSSSGFYAYFDWDTEEIVEVNTLDSEYVCGMIRSLCVPPEHDVGVKAILKPTESGHAVPSMDMELLVKNYGNNTETFDAQMEIIKCEDSGEFLMEEDFSGGVLPDGWDTDYWTIVNSNFASGEAPEARVYRYDQYYGGQYYDNYIQTAPFDATGWEKLTMTFRWASVLYSPQYCNFYVKWRKNETSPWKDLSPWDNPLGEESEGDLYDIDCYGFGQELGENFSILFQYVGYWSYFNYFYLDDIKVEGCGGCAEYAELTEDITLAKGEETTIVFPGWQPSEWQNESFQDTWEAYPVHGFTIMEGDQNPRNNDKWQLLELYYPWFYDIEITEIGSPSEGRSIPAQTFDVEATITNVGQFPACCIGIDMEIGAPYVIGTLFEEYDWPTTGFPYYYRYGPGYGSGWRDEHKNIAYYRGWYWSTTSNSGGDSPEPMLRYYYATADYKFYSAAIDTSEYPSLQLSFLSYINHYSQQGLYALEAGYSHDGENWYAAWHEEPGSSGEYEVECSIECGSETTYIGFWVKGNPFYFNYWYIDNVMLQAVGLEVEWTDFMCQGDDLNPGESRVFNFDPWTPEFLAEETTAWEVPYKTYASIDVEVDQDPGNNILTTDFKLDYWHDCGIDRVDSPAIGGGRGDLLWDNGDTDGTNGYSILGNPRRSLQDDFYADESWAVNEFRCYMVAGPANDWEIAFWSDDDNEPGEEIVGPSVDIEFDTENTGRTWFGYSEWEVLYTFEELELEGGSRYWVDIWSSSSSPNSFLMIRTDMWGEECWVNYDDLGHKPGSQQFGVQKDCNFQMYGEAGGAPGIKAYIQPGTQSIDAVAKNYGTFSELDLVCDAEIWEYITDPDNGTHQYSDQIVDIDLDTPLGGEVALAFDDFTFAYEGRYGLILDMPDENDDFPGNNDMRYGIGVDDTKPVSSHSLEPATPDGDNGWYVSDLEVTLTASDPLSNDVSSGVDMIKYKVGGGSEQTIEGDGVITGSFLITQADDADDLLVEYWAIDNVGNTESKHSFTVDMDQTPPTVDLTYEVISGNPIQGWVLEFTATCYDDTSLMDRVLFYLNAGLQSTVPGLGPTYQWSWTYFGDLSVDITAEAYDQAGNMASDVVEDPKSTEYNQNSQQHTIKILQG